MAKSKAKEPKYIRSPINSKMLNYKVYYMSVGERLLYSLSLFVTGGLIGYIFYGGLFKVDGEVTTATVISNIVVFCIIGIVAVFLLLPQIRKWLKARRDNILRNQFKDLLEALASSLSSGNTVTDSFSNAYTDLQSQHQSSAYIVVELREILNGMGNGHTLEDMLTAFSQRTELEDIQNLSNVISNCFRLGGDFKHAICSTRDIISDKIAIEDEIQTKIASNKLQLNAMALMPIVLVIMMKTTMKSFDESLASPTGIVASTVAIGVFVASYLWGRKIVSVK